MKYLIFLLLLSSCIESVVIGTIATGTAIVQNRKETFGKSDDSDVKKTILRSFELDNKNEEFKKVNVVVFEGRIMLTGYVSDKKYKDISVQKAKAIRTTAEVIDEILVIPNMEGISSNDGWISTQIYTKLKFTSGVISANYDYSVENGVVFIIGATKSQEELKEVTQTIAKIKGVNRVVSYIEVKKQNPFAKK